MKKGCASRHAARVMQCGAIDGIERPTTVKTRAAQWQIADMLSGVTVPELEVIRWSFLPNLIERVLRAPSDGLTNGR